ncbi:MAG: CoA transferase, partial [Dehalococcoidia bacterium]|nr:CoA transferase [Dehalococcoidia bacterium]
MKKAFLDLVKDADVVLENNAARVMAQLGLAFDTLVQHNPRIVMCSMSGYGATGPERNYSANWQQHRDRQRTRQRRRLRLWRVLRHRHVDADRSPGSRRRRHYGRVDDARRTGQGQWIDGRLLESVIPFFYSPSSSTRPAAELPEAARQPLPHHVAGRTLIKLPAPTCRLALRSVRDDADFAALVTAWSVRRSSPPVHLPDRACQRAHQRGHPAVGLPRS